MFKEYHSHTLKKVKIHLQLFLKLSTLFTFQNLYLGKQMKTH